MITGLVDENGKRTKVQAGDTLCFDASAGLALVFSRDQQTTNRLCWSNGDNKRHNCLARSDDDCEELAELIAAVCGLEIERLPKGNSEDIRFVFTKPK